MEPKVEVGVVAFDSKLLEVDVSEVAFGEKLGIEVVAAVRLTAVSIEEALALSCGLCSSTVSSETDPERLHFEACTAKGRRKNLKQRASRRHAIPVRFGSVYDF